MVCLHQSFDLLPATTSVSHLTCPLPPHHQSELALALALEIELVLALDIEHYGMSASVIWLAPCHHISQSFDLPTATTSVSHLTCQLPPHHQSELALALALEIELVLALDIEHYGMSASVIWLAPCHHISQSFDLPTATTSVSHLTCQLPPHHQSELVLALALEIELVLALDIEHYGMSASVIWLAPCHHISQSFDLPTATTSSVRASASTSTRDRASASARHRALWYVCISHLTCPCHHISQSFDLPTATTSSVRASASASTRDRASASARHRALPYHRISQSFDLPPATTSVSHLTCPLPPHQLVIWLALYHYITTLVSHLTCPHHHISQSFDLPPATNQAVIWLAHCHHIIMSPPPLALALALALALVLVLALALGS